MEAGQLIEANLDLTLANDIRAGHKARHTYIAAEKLVFNGVHTHGHLRISLVQGFGAMADAVVRLLHGVKERIGTRALSHQSPVEPHPFGAAQRRVFHVVCAKYGRDAARQGGPAAAFVGRHEGHFALGAEHSFAVGLHGRAYCCDTSIGQGAPQRVAHHIFGIGQGRHALACPEFEEQGGMHARQHRSPLHGHGYVLCTACQYAIGDSRLFSAVNQKVSPQRLAILPRAAHLHVGPARAFL